MKLPIKRKYFDLIKSGQKFDEYRDAHITFVCEETGEELRKEVIASGVFERPKDMYPDELEDENYIKFEIR